MKKVLTILPVFTALVFAGPVSANNFSSSPTSSQNGFAPSTTIGQTNSGAYGFRGARIGDGSSTASKFYRMGVRAYEKNDLQEAERTFRAALLANGLNAESLEYLVKIAEANGEMEKARAYTLEYEQLVSRSTHGGPDTRLFSRIRGTN